VLLVAVSCNARAQTTAALTLSGYVDSAHGSSYDVDAWFAPSTYWSIGGGVGHGDSDLSDVKFSGQSLRLNTDVTFRGFTAGVAAQRWKDSSQLTSDSTEGQLSWTALNGFGLAAIIDDRRLKVSYQVRPLAGQTGTRQVELSGTGYGGELGYYGERWHAAVRGVAYGYGPTLARVRAAASAPTTTQFPRLAALVDSLITRGVSAPEHEISLTLGRTLTRSSLQADWILQRDAVTQADSMSLSLRHSYRFTPHLELATTLGMADGDAFDSIAFGGLALTLRR
jgi:hypothetical protein